jgi:hypothetical protein
MADVRENAAESTKTKPFLTQRHKGSKTLREKQRNSRTASSGGVKIPTLNPTPFNGEGL